MPEANIALSTCPVCGKTFESKTFSRNRVQIHCSRSCAAIARNMKTPEQIFFSPKRCLKTDTCWLWLGSITRKGYGRVNFRGKSTLVHRAVYEYVYGPMPKLKETDHICRVRSCIRPDHLQAITHQQNVARAVYKRAAITAFGETKSQSAWARDKRCTVGRVALQQRLKSGMLPEDAITKPLYVRESNRSAPPKARRPKRLTEKRMDSSAIYY